MNLSKKIFIGTNIGSLFYDAFIFPCDVYFVRYKNYYILFNFWAWEDFSVVTFRREVSVSTVELLPAFFIGSRFLDRIRWFSCSLFCNRPIILYNFRNLTLKNNPPYPWTRSLRTHLWIFHYPKILQQIGFRPQSGVHKSEVVAHERLNEPTVTMKCPSKTKEFFKSPR